jgi:hypothetical protein
MVLLAGNGGVETDKTMRVWRSSATKQTSPAGAWIHFLNFIKVQQHKHVENSWLSAPIMVQLENEALSLETEHPQRYVDRSIAPIIWPVARHRSNKASGYDLQGNTFWEFKDALNAGRQRRIVKYNSWTHHGDVKVPRQSRPIHPARTFN